jgi:hypothetical protein
MKIDKVPTAADERGGLGSCKSVIIPASAAADPAFPIAFKELC